ncbi:MAG: hypothetical protein A2V98_18160 [Planctomycetes bacterium RBG_16_64_12]|nr:MAG: hypothetical protein A2V98_18160 [Planctomycetes bacterium RBG_16_64_12]
MTPSDVAKWNEVRGDAAHALGQIGAEPQHDAKDVRPPPFAAGQVDPCPRAEIEKGGWHDDIHRVYCDCSRGCIA